MHRHNFPSPLRYPGGKAALANFIKLVLKENNLVDGHYVEVYAGGAGIAWPLLFEEYVRFVSINDISKSVCSFWKAVLQDTEDLCKLIHDTPISTEEWLRQRVVQSNPNDFSPLDLGFSTFFLNRTNRSGILRGGIIGGKSQNGKWKIDARFNKEELIHRIQRIALYSSRIKLYELDACDFIDTVLPGLPSKALVYFDPPYYKKGSELYENHYSHKDHVKLARRIRNRVNNPWIVSYDFCPEIASIYRKSRNVRYDLNYSAQERYAGPEIMYFSENIIIPSKSEFDQPDSNEFLVNFVNPVGIQRIDLLTPIL